MKDKKTIKKKRAPGHRPLSPYGTFAKTNEQYAIDYGRTIATIIKWKRDKAPLDDTVAMVTWMDAQGITPPKQFEGALKTMTMNQLKEEDLRLKVRRSQLQVDQQLGNVISKEKVREHGARLGSIIDAELRSLEANMPGMLAGLSEVEVKIKISKFLADFKVSTKANIMKVLAEIEEQAKS